MDRLVTTQPRLVPDFLTADGFEAALRGLIRAKPFNEHPFFREVREGRATREQLADWMCEFLAFGRANTWILTAIHSNCPDLNARRMMVENLIDEETNRQCGSEPHPLLGLRFAQALGRSEDEVWNWEPSVTMKMGIAWNMQMARRTPWQLAMAATAGPGEIPFSPAAKDFAAGCLKHYGMTDDEVEFFTVHVEGDAEHGDVAMKIVTSYANTPEKRQECYQAWKDGVDVWYAMIDACCRATELKMGRW